MASPAAPTTSTSGVLKYACVCREGSLLAEYPVQEQPKLAMTIGKIIAGHNPLEYCRESVVEPTATYHILVVGNPTREVIAVASTPDFPQRRAFAFIDEMEKLLASPTFDTRNLKKQLQAKLAFYNDPANDLIAATLLKLDKAKDEVTNAIDSAMRRGDTVARVEDKSKLLVTTARSMQEKATEVHNKYWWKNVKIMGAIALAVITLILIIVLAVCSPSFNSC